MPIKVSLGVSRKVGQPNYGSLGASCSAEVELDQQDPGADPQAFQRHVQEAFAMCRQAVETELSRSASGSATPVSPTQASTVHSVHAGPAESPPPRPATPAQVQAINAIAARLGIGLSGPLQQFGVSSAANLSLPQASRLIDQLKQSRAPASA